MTTTTRKPRPATPEALAADLEAAAADAAARAAEARSAADVRSRVELAASGRAEEAWSAEQIAARRPHLAGERVDQAWTALLDEITTGTTDLIGAWARFQTTLGEGVATVRPFENVGGPKVSHRWDPQRAHENPTLTDAITAAAHRAGTAARITAHDRVEEQIDAERQAHRAAAVAALPDDAVARAVATFWAPDGALGWQMFAQNSLLDLSGLEAHPSGVAYVYSLALARQLRAAVAGTGRHGTREIDELEAARLCLAHENGEHASPEWADHARATHHAERLAGLPYTPGDVTDRKRAAITERSDAAAPTVDPDRA